MTGMIGIFSVFTFGAPAAAKITETMALVDELPFTKLHVFRYSRRPGTPAAEMPDGAAPGEARDRMARLIDLGKRKRSEFALSFIGQRVKVLVEHIDEKRTASGWTEQYLPCRISGYTMAANATTTVVPTATDDDLLLC